MATTVPVLVSFITDAIEYAYPIVELISIGTGITREVVIILVTISRNTNRLGRIRIDILNESIVAAVTLRRYSDRPAY